MVLQNEICRICIIMYFQKEHFQNQNRFIEVFNNKVQVS